MYKKGGGGGGKRWLQKKELGKEKTFDFAKGLPRKFHIENEK